MLALLAVLAAPIPAPDPACVTVPIAVASAEAAGGHMIDLIAVDGETVDQLLFVAVNGLIQMWGVREGCMIGPTMPLDKVKDRGQPA
jgi:hypothetical protein